MALWTVTQPKDDGTEQTFEYGGLPISVGYYIDYSQNYTVQVGGQMVFDIIGGQVSGTGGYITLAYHLWGGARRKTLDAEYASIIRKNPTIFLV